MKNMVILLDTNVLIDYLATREPYFQDAKNIMKLCTTGEVIGYAVLHSISNIFFILRKVCDDQKRRKLLKELCNIITVTGASHNRVTEAIERGEFTDFEDCLQDECAQENTLDYSI